jgi:hypothetical protein
MSLFTLLPYHEIARVQIFAVTEAVKTNANALLTGSSAEHAVNSANPTKCCYHILTILDR